MTKYKFSIKALSRIISEAIEKKFDPTQRRDELGRWTKDNYTVYEGEDIEKVLDKVYSMLEITYAAIGNRYNNAQELLEDEKNSQFHVITDQEGKEVAFIISKKTPFGNKLTAGGSDGSSSGKVNFIDAYLRFLDKKGNYAEVSMALEHIGRKNNKQVVPFSDVEKILYPKKLTPESDGTHYSREIAGVSHVKLMLGKPKIKQDYAISKDKNILLLDIWKQQLSNESTRSKKNLKIKVLRTKSETKSKKHSTRFIYLISDKAYNKDQRRDARGRWTKDRVIEQIGGEDTSELFGLGTSQVGFLHRDSGAKLMLIVRANEPASVLSLEVPEEHRRQGIAKDLQRAAMEAYPNLQGQVSSEYAARSAYALGRRPYSKPQASLQETLDLIAKNSSVNMVSPQFNPYTGQPKASR